MKFNLKKPNLRGTFIVNLWKSSTRDLVNPKRDWAIGLATATTLFLGGVFYIALDFYGQFIAPNESAAPQVQSLIYRDADIRELAKTYDGKEKIFIELRKNRVYVPPAPTAESDTEPLTGGGDSSLADSPPTE